MGHMTLLTSSLRPVSEFSWPTPGFVANRAYNGITLISVCGV